MSAFPLHYAEFYVVINDLYRDDIVYIGVIKNTPKNL